MRGKLTMLFVVVFTLVCIVSEFYSPVPTPQFLYDVDDLTLDKVKLVNFSPAEDAAIRKELRHLLYPPCTVAFSKAGLRSPLEVVTEEGVVIRPSVDLYEYSAKELGLVS
ncbi:MAG TPA: hypothetical protein VD835_16970, partial [Pyrinomonadaceae bacterium]|nr:hypothetical protein [Pyrinomonadaceae bacterium]